MEDSTQRGFQTCCGSQSSQSRAPLESQHAELITKSRAAPRPIFRIKHQLRFRRIVFNVTNGLPLVLGIAHVSVEIILRPECAPFAEEFVRKPPCVLFPSA